MTAKETRYMGFEPNPTFHTLKLLNERRPDIKYGFSSEKFGNMSFNWTDSPPQVLLNEKGFLKTVGIDYQDLVLMAPVHGTNIVVVDSHDRGKGVYDIKSGIPRTDGLVTQDRDVALGVKPADCAPILIVHKNSDNPIKALIHAGRVGTEAEIAIKIISKLKTEFSVEPQDLLVGIGPTIHYARGSMRTDNPDKWLPYLYIDEGHGADIQVELIEGMESPTYLIKSTKASMPLRLDLVEANIAQLVTAGIPRENIEASHICTYCNAEDHLIFSHDFSEDFKQPQARFMAVIQ